MSKFNTLERVVADTVNRAGGEAYTETPEVALVNLLLTSFMKEKHYESASDEQKRLDGLLGKVDPKFAAKAGVYARQRFGMRSITHFQADECGRRMPCWQKLNQLSNPARSRSTSLAYFHLSKPLRHTARLTSTTLAN
jgi:hypothetical protein